jgi:hypothetical protein
MAAVAREVFGKDQGRVQAHARAVTQLTQRPVADAAPDAAAPDAGAR